MTPHTGAEGSPVAGRRGRRGGRAAGPFTPGGPLVACSPLSPCCTPARARRDGAFLMPCAAPDFPRAMGRGRGPGQSSLLGVTAGPAVKARGYQLSAGCPPVSGGASGHRETS